MSLRRSNESRDVLIIDSSRRNIVVVLQDSITCIKLKSSGDIAGRHIIDPLR
jgi:hypothetical protein